MSRQVWGALLLVVVVVMIAVFAPDPGDEWHPPRPTDTLVTVP